MIMAFHGSTTYRVVYLRRGRMMAEAETAPLRRRQPRGQISRRAGGDGESLCSLPVLDPLVRLCSYRWEAKVAIACAVEAVQVMESGE